MGELKLLLVSHSVHGTAELHLPPKIGNLPQVIAYVQYKHLKRKKKNHKNNQKEAHH